MSENLAQLVEDLRTQSALGNKARMVQLCGQISAIDPGNPEVLITTGMLAWRHGKRDEAEKLLRQAAEHHPDDPECQSSLADILAARGSHAEAIEYYRRSVAKRPGHSSTLLRASRTMLRAGDTAAAISLLTEAVHRDDIAASGSREDLWREVAALHLRENRIGDALSALASARGTDVPGVAQAEVFEQGDSLLDYCQSNGFEAQVMDDLAMTRMSDPDNAAARPASACALENVRLLGTSFVPVTADGKFFAEGLVPNPEKIISPLAGVYNDVVQVSDGRKILAAADRAQSFEGEYFFVGFHENFGHWMLNIFSRLMIAARFPQLKSLPLVLGHGVGDMHFDCLARAGYSRDQVVIVEPDTIYEFEKLWMPSMLYHGYRGELYWTPKIVDFVRDTLLLEIPAAPRSNKRYYLSRLTARWRRLVNEKDVIARAEANGFEVIDPADYSIAEQAEMAMDAEVIMGPAGAGMMMLLFAAPGTNVIEMIYDFPAMDIHPTVCGHVGLHYHRVLGEAVRQGDDPLNHDFAVDIADVERVLAEVLNQPANV